MQMLLYGLAAERILGVAPCELVLHFLRTGEEQAFPWNDAARTARDEARHQGIAAAALAPPPSPAYCRLQAAL